MRTEVVALLVVVMAGSFFSTYGWYDHVTDDFFSPAISWTTKRERVIEEARSCAASQSFDVRGQVNQSRLPTNRETEPQKRQRVLGRASINAALQGDKFTPGGGVKEHPTSCAFNFTSGSPCFTNLWQSRDALEVHLQRFMGFSAEVRSEHVFSLIRDSLYSDWDADGNEVGKPYFHYHVNGRDVCMHTFLLAYPIGQSKLYELQARVRSNCTCAHAKHEEGAAAAGQSEGRVDYGAAGVIGWYLGYADQMGDYMPDEQHIIVPRREVTGELYDEYQAALGQDAVKPAYFARVIRNAPELHHIRPMRKVLNFQDCTECSDLAELVKSAIASHNPARVAQAKAKRAAHRQKQRTERLKYYEKRELGRAGFTADGRSCVSMIFDKWDSAKTTVPWFVRPPKCWTKLSHDVLEQHVLGFLVHGSPSNHVFLFTFNGTIKGDANVNIEGTRRVLLKLYAERPMPQIIFANADNASDNKCWAMLLFWAMLVLHGYTEEVFFSFLLVGHTHEDIDQLFSRLTAYLREKHGNVWTPQQFQAAMKVCLSGDPAYVETVETVLDWTGFLTPHLRTPAPVGIQHTEVEVETEKGTVEKVKLVPHTFWIHKRDDGKVVLHYKELCADTIWYPPIDVYAKPQKTDPAGIVLFDTPPPDPMTTPPKEVELTSAVCTCKRCENAPTIG